MLPTALERVSYPVASSYLAQNKTQKLYKLVDKCLKYSAIIMIALALITISFGEEIIQLIFGNGFEPSIPVLKILAVAAVFMGVVKSLGSLYAAAGRVEVNLFITTLVTFANILLNLLWIPRFGIMGAAFASLFSYSLFFTLFSVFLPRVIGYFIPLRWILRLMILVFTCSTLLGIMSYLSPSHFPRLFIILLYLIGSWIFLVSGEDKKFIRKIVSE